MVTGMTPRLPQVGAQLDEGEAGDFPKPAVLREGGDGPFASTPAMPRSKAAAANWSGFWR